MPATERMGALRDALVDRAPIHLDDQSPSKVSWTLLVLSVVLLSVMEAHLLYVGTRLALGILLPLVMVWWHLLLWPAIISVWTCKSWRSALVYPYARDTNTRFYASGSLVLLVLMVSLSNRMSISYQFVLALVWFFFIMDVAGRCRTYAERVLNNGERLRTLSLGSLVLPLVAVMGGLALTPGIMLVFQGPGFIVILWNAVLFTITNALGACIVGAPLRHLRRHLRHSD